MLLIQRETLTDLQRIAFTMIQNQRVYLRLARECAESANAWRRCLELAQQCGATEIQKIAQEQLDIHLASAHGCRIGAELYAPSAEKYADLVRRSTEQFYLNRTQFNAMDIELPDAEAELAAVNAKINVDLSDELLPPEQALRFIRQLEQQAPALS